MSDVSLASARRLHSVLCITDVIKRIDLRAEPSKFVYWADLLASTCIAWAFFVVAAQALPGSLVHIAATLGAILAMLRAALFIHELSHFTRGQLPGFELAWNALIGIPMLIPSLMYVGSHLDHHTRMGFGTNDDPEYAPIARWSRLRIVAFVFTVALLPLVLPLRWGLLGPLSYLVSPLRRLVVAKLSTLVINSDYIRPMPRGAHVRRWQVQEAAAAVFVWSIAVAAYFGWVPLQWIVQWCLVGGGVLTVNQLRTLAAHHYENEGGTMDVEEQLLDSITLRGWPLLTVLIAPVGLRYHALHHYLPYLPYHSLGRVHRHLLSELPQSASYRATLRNGLHTVQSLWRNAGGGEVSAQISLPEHS
jgi:fatty acid desaturase